MSKATHWREIFPICPNEYFPITKSCYKYFIWFLTAPNAIDLNGTFSQKQVKWGYQLSVIFLKWFFYCHTKLPKFCSILSCNLGHITCHKSTLWQKRQNSHRLLLNTTQMWVWPAGSVPASRSAVQIVKNRSVGFLPHRANKILTSKWCYSPKQMNLYLGTPGSPHPWWDFKKHNSTLNASHWFSIECKSHLWFLELQTNNCFDNTLCY